jgi:hypothetical protein
LKNRIKNIEGWSTSSEEAPEYFGAKGALSLKNENIMCDIRQTNASLARQAQLVTIVNYDHNLFIEFATSRGEDGGSKVQS